MNLLPMTELEAVNLMLELIAEPPVNSLEGSVPIEVSIAQSTLRNVSREVQTQGWSFNTETNFPLAPDINGYIIPPVNTISIDASDSTDIVIRGGKLYDKGTHSNIFTEPLNVDITWFLDFTDLPQFARSYITIRAARIFQKSQLGSDTIDRLTIEDERKALLLIQYNESDINDYNVLKHKDITRITARNSNP